MPLLWRQRWSGEFRKSYSLMRPLLLISLQLLLAL
jgi:hypothetical protein